MLSKLLRFAAPLVALALFAMAPPNASAASLDYSTSGVFGSNSSSSITDSGITITLNPNVSNGLVIADGSTGNAALGKFVVTGSFPSSANFSDTFTLKVTQTQPTPGGNQTFGQASISGNIAWNGASGFVQFTSPLSVTIGSNPPVIYTISSADQTAPGKLLLNSPNSNGGETTINGTATVVPLPATANMGIALLVCLAGAGVWRKVKNSQAVA
jgi:hypothetical protein